MHTYLGLFSTQITEGKRLGYTAAGFGFRPHCQKTFRSERETNKGMPEK